MRYVMIGCLAAFIVMAPDVAAAKAIAVPVMLSGDNIGPDETDHFDQGQMNLIRALAADPNSHGMAAGKYVVLPPDISPAHGWQVDVLDMIASRNFHCALKGTYAEGRVVAAKAFVQIVPGPDPQDPAKGMKLVRVSPPVCDESAR